MEENFKNTLIQLHKEGLSNRQIALNIGVNRVKINEHIKELGLRPRRNRPIRIDGKIICNRCEQPVSETKFAINRKGERYEYKLGTCNSCRNKMIYANALSTIDKYLHHRGASIKKKCGYSSTPYKITDQELRLIYDKQNGKCFYTDVDLKWGKTAVRERLSFDKIIPELGYVSGNVVLCSARANTIKSDLSLLEIKEYMPPWFDKIVKFVQGNSTEEVIRMWQSIGLADRVFNVGNGREF